MLEKSRFWRYFKDKGEYPPISDISASLPPIEIIVAFVVTFVSIVGLAQFFLWFSKGGKEKIKASLAERKKRQEAEAAVQKKSDEAQKAWEEKNGGHTEEKTIMSEEEGDEFAKTLNLPPGTFPPGTKVTTTRTKGRPPSDRFSGLPRGGFNFMPSPEVKTAVHQPDDKTDYKQALEEMTGIDAAKKSIKQVIDGMHFQQLRVEKGLTGSRSSMHLVFTGNPGTGKTTVARIVGGILKEYKYLKSGHVVEVSVPEIIGRFVGETPQKVTSVVNQAIDGVLFIDEAYALVPPGMIGGGYGAEAVATLLKMMEDLRDRIVIIAAGYPREMNQFLETNPGFRSRFTEIVHFEDYPPAQLADIYFNLAEKEQYLLPDPSKALVRDVMEKAPGLFPKNFSNGRFVRNMFEDSVKYAGSRIASVKEPSKDDLMTLMVEDIRAAFEENKPREGEVRDKEQAVHFYTQQ